MLKSILIRKSIARKILLPMVWVLLLQSFIFAGTILYGGTIDHLEENSYNILNEQVSSRRNYIQNEMIQRWSNLAEYTEIINTKLIASAINNNLPTSQLNTNSDAVSLMIDNVSDDLIAMLRKNYVTGAFIILETSNEEQNNFEKQGIYIRDLDPISNPKDTSDLLVEFGPSNTIKRLGIALDSNWSPQINLNDSESRDFYDKPFIAALNNPTISSSDLGYWSKPFKLHETDINIITYSIPLKDNYERPYGILGVEISTDYIRSLLPYSDLNSDDNGAYCLAVGNTENNEYTNVVSSGPIYKKILGDSNILNFHTEPINKDIFSLINSEYSSSEVSGCIKSIKLYNRNTPFENDKWVLIGMVENSNLLSFSSSVKFSVLLAFIISIIIGIIGTIIAGIHFTVPITSLVEKVKKSSPESPIKFEKINVNEIDELASAIEILNLNVIEFSSKLSQIISLANLHIGTFEYDINSDRVFCTDALFNMLNINNNFKGSTYISKSLFEERLSILTDEIKPDINKVYRLIDKHNLSKWVKLKTINNNGKILGVLIDVTNETLEKRKIEHERDHDSMTKLLNRRAFNTLVKEKLSSENISHAAFIMCDLDNLKTANDNYGHDIGDQYIQKAASILNIFSEEYNGIVARMSGDEFYAFIDGYDSKEIIREIIMHVEKKMKESFILLPDGSKFQIRASVGVSWYPDDGISYEELSKYADFAMYEVKNSIKNDIKEFNRENYIMAAKLLKNKEELNLLLKENLVKYVFQPIISSQDGSIFGYEALMRPNVETLKSPSDVINLASVNSKLYDLEKLTWFKVLEYYIKQIDKFKDSKIFINSVPNQNLNENDIAIIENKYKKYLKNIVIEIIKSEQADNISIYKKQKTALKWNSAISLDDFGASYNNAANLLNLKPDFVKIDTSIIHSIDKDSNKQKFMQNISKYAHERNINVIAEGIENLREMETVIFCGADYIQGYYIAEPSPNINYIKPHVIEEIKAFWSK